MIADPVAGLLDLGQDVARQEDRPALRLRLADEVVERLLDERIESGRRLVEDEQLRPVLERDDEPDLLLVALRVLAELATRIDVEALDELRPGRPRRRCRAGSRNTRSSARPSACRTGRTRPAGSRDARWIAIGSSCVSMPKIRALPDVGRRWSSRVRMVVVLPAPFGPRKPNASPSSTVRSSSMIPRWLPYDLVSRSGLDDVSSCAAP